MLCGLFVFRPHSSSDPLFPRYARAGHLPPRGKGFFRPCGAGGDVEDAVPYDMYPIIYLISSIEYLISPRMQPVAR